MQVELFLQPTEIIAIFREAGTVTVDSRSIGQAYAPDFSQIKVWIGRIWSTIEEAMAAVAEQGKSEINRWVVRIQDEIKELRADLGEASQAVLSAIGERIAASCQGIREAMLKLLPTTLTIKGITVGLSTLGLEYQIEVQQEVVASLTWALNIVAGGTLSVSATYALQPATNG